jgi:hypothetical protein
MLKRQTCQHATAAKLLRNRRLVDAGKIKGSSDCETNRGCGGGPWPPLAASSE